MSGCQTLVCHHYNEKDSFAVNLGGWKKKLMNYNFKDAERQKAVNKETFLILATTYNY